MSNQSRYLGVDVSKDLLVVAFERNHWQFPNSKEGYRKLILLPQAHLISDSETGESVRARAYFPNAKIS